MRWEHAELSLTHAQLWPAHVNLCVYIFKGSKIVHLVSTPTEDLSTLLAPPRKNVWRREEPVRNSSSQLMVRITQGSKTIACVLTSQTLLRTDLNVGIFETKVPLEKRAKTPKNVPLIDPFHS